MTPEHPDVPGQMELADALEPVNAGMAETARAADDWWWAQATQAVRQLAREGRPFQAYDLVERFGVPEPANGKAQWGALFAALRKAGLVEHHGYTTSRRPTAQGSACRQWIGAAAAIRDAA